MFVVIVIDVAGVIVNWIHGFFENISCMLLPIDNNNCFVLFLIHFIGKNMKNLANCSKNAFLSPWLSFSAWTPRLGWNFCISNIVYSHPCEFPLCSHNLILIVSLIHVCRFVSLQKWSIYWMSHCNLLRSCFCIIYRDNTADWNNWLNTRYRSFK